MRNLLEYPVTFKEKIDLLEYYYHKWYTTDDESCGDMTGEILRTIMDEISEIHTLKQTEITQPKDS